MIIMKYNGGLGNQMFQYAAAVSCAQRLGVQAKFDHSFFSKGYARAYGMDIFGVEPDAVRDFRINAYWALRRYGDFKKFLGLNIYSEEDFAYEKRFEEIEDNTFIHGFFQSAKYFDEKLVRSALTFKKAPEGLNAQTAQKIAASNSVSIHIRRGDYVQKARYAKLYNHLDIEYYGTAKKIIKNKVENPQYFVFSDDIAWVKENMKPENAHYIEHNSGDNSWEDMRLMSLCKHNIIANSSFSWWGAYLNRNPQKIVVAPKLWFLDPAKDTKDVALPDWVLL